ncbi:hypothetical protein OCF84_20980 (plasmid) [Shewanella xiamenensis]|uniref:Uncharacterized protein n=1 Tax=Shewanella xiamenensis TaxID=332186 RepID=A0ABT6UFK9_9GAMM|nr:hypothetical protein [Shewanella xiamenensis]MDI5833255.1 hypothetical protein [Shewanella xiamenensis]WHF57994.1 hypothetical protein OCF84_20980 [Shewanella xiamenensis]
MKQLLFLSVLIVSATTQAEDELVFTNVKTTDIVNEIKVVTTKSKVKSGSEIYKRDNGSCYGKTYDLQQIEKRATQFGEIDLPTVKESQFDTACPITK